MSVTLEMAGAELSAEKSKEEEELEVLGVLFSSAEVMDRRHTSLWQIAHQILIKSKSRWLLRPSLVIGQVQR